MKTNQLHLALLWSDWIVWILFFAAIAAMFWMRKQPNLAEPWRQVLKRKIGMIAMVFLGFYVTIGLLDSIHFQVNTTNAQGQQSTSVNKSVLDLILNPLGQEEEKTYSAPFATHLYNKSLITTAAGKEMRGYPRLKFGGANLTDPQRQKSGDITKRAFMGAAIGMISFMILASLLIRLLSWRNKRSWRDELYRTACGQSSIAWREALLTFGLIWTTIFICAFLATHYHILGTDKIGRDVFYEAIKSIRTGLLIGTLTTLFMLPFALFFGTVAGYYRGWIDDMIQYLYTTLSSIPGVLLISAAVLVLQVYIANHSNLFPTLPERADARLLALCFILGITSWAGLCRLLRGETLKLRDMEYIQAARSLGVKRRKIILRHILPNVMHIVLITLVLDFSGLVLAEAVLSYVGVGVDPTTMSWGNMINSSRLELAREPVVWWPLIAALIFMFILVLSANVFADSVRDAFDPKLKNRN